MYPSPCGSQTTSLPVWSHRLSKFALIRVLSYVLKYAPTTACVLSEIARKRTRLGSRQKARTNVQETAFGRINID